MEDGSISGRLRSPEASAAWCEKGSQSYTSSKKLVEFQPHGLPGMSCSTRMDFHVRPLWRRKWRLGRSSLGGGRVCEYLVGMVLRSLSSSIHGRAFPGHPGTNRRVSLDQYPGYREHFRLRKEPKVTSISSPMRLPSTGVSDELVIFR